MHRPAHLHLLPRVGRGEVRGAVQGGHLGGGLLLHLPGEGGAPLTSPLQCQWEGSAGCSPTSGLCFCREGWRGQACGERITTTTPTTSTATTSTTETSTTATTTSKTITITTTTTSTVSATTTNQNPPSSTSPPAASPPPGISPLISRQADLLLVGLLGGVFFLLLLLALALTVLLCRKWVSRLKERRRVGVRQGVVRQGPPPSNIYEELQLTYLEPTGGRPTGLKPTGLKPSCLKSTGLIVKMED